jgi:hypothetical protein
MRLALKSGLLLGLFAFAARGQDSFLQPPRQVPPGTDYLNSEAWKRAFQDLFSHSNKRIKPLPTRLLLMDGNGPHECSVRLLEVPLPRDIESWSPQIIPPAEGYATAETQVPAPACPKS